MEKIMLVGFRVSPPELLSGLWLLMLMITAINFFLVLLQ